MSTFHYDCLMCGGGVRPSSSAGVTCMDCHDEQEKDYRKIRSYRDKGHTSECARRIVWGDGECVCGIREARDELALVRFCAVCSAQKHGHAMLMLHMQPVGSLCQEHEEQAEAARARLKGGGR